MADIIDTLTTGGATLEPEKQDPLRPWNPPDPPVLTLPFVQGMALDHDRESNGRSWENFAVTISEACIARGFTELRVDIAGDYPENSDRRALGDDGRPLPRPLVIIRPPQTQHSKNVQR